MLKTKVITEKGSQYLEIKKDRSRILIDVEVLPELDAFLQEGTDATFEECDGIVIRQNQGILIVEAGKNKVVFNIDESSQLSTAVSEAVGSKVYLEELGIKESVFTFEPEEPLAEEIIMPKQEVPRPSKLSVLEILLASIEWEAYVTCPGCKVKHQLDTKANPASSSQLATQCVCGQILFLQK